ncbi:MAG: hypothetical protein CTY16_05395 [Methylobacter sp.]|nr:MAG: hypothetical protein CTY16_05395 [Methylobacter sp.]
MNPIQQFCAAGLHLVAIPPIKGNPTKAPRHPGWNKPRHTDNPSGYSAKADDFNHCRGFNFGLYHGASQTLALDLDNVALARQVFEESANVKLSDWLSDDRRAEIKSPKKNRGKLLFKLPEGFNNGSLRQFKHNNKVIFEFRCGNCQDVIHGRHPEGGHYQFIGNPADIPLIPDVLLDMLQHWEAWKPCFDSVLGIQPEASKIRTPEIQTKKDLAGKRDPIAEFNQAHSVQSVLLANGYQAAGRDRFIRPDSESKAPGAVIMRQCADSMERVYSHGGDVLNDGYAHDAFDCFRLLACGGDLAEALNWDTDITQHNRQLFRQEKFKTVSPPLADCVNDPGQAEALDNKAGESPKTSAIAALLANVERVDLAGICESLGWRGGDDESPKQKHFKVAIVDTLIKTAKRHNWHIIHDAGFFYIFNGAYWVVLLDAEVKQLLKDAAIKMGYTEIECRDANFVDKLFQQAIQDGFFTERHLKKQSIINLNNGSLVLDEQGVKLKPFDYRDFLTHQLDFDYIPQARNAVFLDYLADVLPNADTRRTLQQVAGYLFVKGLKMEKIFFLFGTGANGKSVFFEVISGVIGAENIGNYSLESLTDDKGYHRAMIKDKIVNYGTDIRLTKIDAGHFKTLASGEPIEARLPYREPFLMTDYAKLIFNVNKMDSANIEHTHGFYRRLLIVPFNTTIPDDQQDRDLHKKILLDRAGVLNWLIEGAEQVIKNRMIFISEECERFKQQFIKETDSVAMFEEYVFEEMPGTIYFKRVTEAYNSYKDFCHEAGHKPLGRNNFTKRMESLGFTKNKKEGGWHLEKHVFDKTM